MTLLKELIPCLLVGINYLIVVHMIKEWYEEKKREREYWESMETTTFHLGTWEVWEDKTTKKLMARRVSDENTRC